MGKGLDRTTYSTEINVDINFRRYNVETFTERLPILSIPWKMWTYKPNFESITETLDKVMTESVSHDQVSELRKFDRRLYCSYSLTDVSWFQCPTVLLWEERMF